MLKRDLQEIIANGESSTVEFKRDDVGAEKLAKEFVAFLNFKGGRVLLGVEDDGTISGLTRQNTEEWIMDTVFRHYVQPQAIPEYEEVRMDDEKTVAVVTVSMGLLKPYAVRHNERDGIYIRIGTTSTLAKREQQMRLMESGGFLHVETLPISGTGTRDLDMRRLAEYLTTIAGDPAAPASEEEWTQRLVNLDILKVDDAGNAACSLAGLLLFGKQPKPKYPYAGIRILVFPGTEKDYNAHVDEWLVRPIVRLKGTAERIGADVLEPDIVEQAMVKLRAHISEERLEETTRVRVWAYPKEAIRELLVNALAHRDYTKAVEIEVGVYSDRLEIVSPGSPPNGQTKEKMLAGQRNARNMIIADIMRDYGMGERRGMGLRRRVVPLMVAQNGVEPVFEITEDHVKVILPKRTRT